MSYFGSPLYFGPFGATPAAVVASASIPAGDSLIDEVFSVLQTEFKVGDYADIPIFDTVGEPTEGNECVIVAKTGETILRGGDWYNEEKVTIRLTGAASDPRRAEEIEDAAFRALLDSVHLSVSVDQGTIKEFQDDSNESGMFFVSHTLEVR